MSVLPDATDGSSRNVQVESKNGEDISNDQPAKQMANLPYSIRPKSLDVSRNPPGISKVREVVIELQNRKATRDDFILTKFYKIYLSLLMGRLHKLFHSIWEHEICPTTGIHLLSCYLFPEYQLDGSWGKGFRVLLLNRFTAVRDCPIRSNHGFRRGTDCVEQMFTQLLSTGTSLQYAEVNCILPYQFSCCF